MPDDTKLNLEPIEESDLKLKEKFLGGSEETETKTEAPSIPEQSLEKKEGEAEKEDAYSKILSKVPVAKPALAEEVATDAQITMREKDIESKIDSLVAIADSKGIFHAVKVAKHMEDNYVLDEFHDRLLSDELHNALVNRGMIKEI